MILTETQKEHLEYLAQEFERRTSGLIKAKELISATESGNLTLEFVHSSESSSTPKLFAVWHSMVNGFLHINAALNMTPKARVSRLFDWAEKKAKLDKLSGVVFISSVAQLIDYGMMQGWGYAGTVVRKRF